MAFPQFHDLLPGYHTCLFYNTKTEQMSAVLPFIKDGLARRECCIYVADEHTGADIQAALQADGLDVDRYGKQGALLLLTKYESFLRYARFEPQIMIEFLDKLVGQALNQGFTGVRFTSEMTWALSNGCERLMEYEALVNKWYPKWRTVGMCQYNRTRFAGQIQRDVLRTHPIAIVKDSVYPNFYYEPPEIFLGQKPETHRVEWMLANLKSGQANVNGRPSD